MIRLGWADMTTSSPQLRSRRFVYFAWTHSASQFDRFPPPCPTTSRLRDIPTGNIRQQKVHSSPYVWLSKSLCRCGGQLETPESSRLRRIPSPAPAMRPRSLPTTWQNSGPASEPTCRKPPLWKSTHPHASPTELGWESEIGNYLPNTL
jgi:hypothetical protein